MVATLVRIPVGCAYPAPRAPLYTALARRGWLWVAQEPEVGRVVDRRRPQGTSHPECICPVVDLWSSSRRLPMSEPRFRMWGWLCGARFPPEPRPQRNALLRHQTSQGAALNVLRLARHAAGLLAKAPLLLCRRSCYPNSALSRWGNPTCAIQRRIPPKTDRNQAKPSPNQAD